MRLNLKYHDILTYKFNFKSKFSNMNNEYNKSFLTKRPLTVNSPRIINSLLLDFGNLGLFFSMFH